MKKFLFFLLTASIPLCILAQTDCETSQSHIIYALSNTSKALEANNMTHLKEYSQKALMAFQRVEKTIKTCECENIEEFTYQGIRFLSKVEGTVLFNDARYYANKGKIYAKKTIEQLDLCTVLSDEMEILSSLAVEQHQLEQEREALIAQEKEIKQRLAAQSDNEFRLKKEQLIKTYRAALSTNVETYNKVLRVCDCEHDLIDEVEHDEALAEKSVDYIKAHYLTNLKDLTSNYLNTLSICDDDDDE